MDGSFDYVIVGAGSAGCVLANRLTEDGRNTVALIEAGGRDTNPWIHIPIGFAKTMFDPRVNWCYTLEPDPGVNGRSIYYPRGKVLGGSSSINGMVYIRGQQQDYDHWRQLGNEGWGWNDVLPLFRRSENYRGGTDEFHGTGGTLMVSDLPPHELCEAFIAAAEKAGIARNRDFNGATQDGVGYFQVTARNGRRCSAADAFLKPAMARKNLSVITDALVERICFTGRKATGIVYRRADEDHQLQARRLVILCAGAFNTPALLQLSGIGPGPLLTRCAIPVIHDLRGVGEGLQDHLHVKIVHRASRKVSLNDALARPLGKIRMGAQYALFRSGPLTIAAGQVGAFVRTRPELATPDVQFHFLTYSTDNPKEGLHRFSGFTTTVAPLRPESRGWVRIRSRDAGERPAICCNYLSAQHDIDAVMAGFEIVRRIAATAPLRDYIEQENSPGAQLRRGDELLDFIRNNAISLSHAAGTCRMGRDTDSVVDPKLRVHGVDGLMVADASIMPTIVSGNTNAAAIMIGEKAADLIQ